MKRYKNERPLSGARRSPCCGFYIGFNNLITLYLMVIEKTQTINYLLILTKGSYVAQHWYNFLFFDISLESINLIIIMHINDDCISDVRKIKEKRTSGATVAEKVITRKHRVNRCVKTTLVERSRSLTPLSTTARGCELATTLNSLLSHYLPACFRFVFSLERKKWAQNDCEFGINCWAISMHNPGKG